MKYTLTIISSLALVSLVSAIAPAAATAASHENSASFYAVPSPPSANNYVKADDYD